jgi:hypothetical protein
MPIFLTRLAFAIATLLIASAVFVGASAFLCYAVFLFLAQWVPPAFAALATALVLLAFACVVLFIGRGLVPNGRLRARNGDGAPASSETLEALLGADIAAYAAKSPFATTGIAFLVGLIFGFSPRLRRVAAELLRR